MTLTPRQRVKLNAALSLITLHGHNPRPVQQAANAAIAKGAAPADAYSDALEAFAKSTPAIRETLATILELIQNSDEPTLAQYDQALNEFNQTGDNSALEALGPLIVDDFKALIVAKGLATADDVAGYDWDITDALAFDTGAVAAEPWDPTPAEFNAPAATAEGTQEGNNMTALNAKQYADAVRELRANSNGQPIENTPEYAALQGRLLGNAPVASGPAPTTRNGDAYIPGQFTATGYRAPMTGDRARSYAGTPIWNGNPE